VSRGATALHRINQLGRTGPGRMLARFPGGRRADRQRVAVVSVIAMSICSARAKSLVVMPLAEWVDR
jgi:hypothetical protein